MVVSREWQFQKDFLRKVHNREVNEYFRDVEGDDWESLTSRKAAKKACSIGPKDSQNIALSKQITFYFTVGKAHLKPEIYGIPTDVFQEEVTFRPIIQLFFRQDEEAAPEGYRAIRGQFSFRLVNETSKTITKAKLTEIAREIKNQFGSGNGLIWNRGKVKRVCKDKENGINLSILCLNESEGTDIIHRVYNVLDIPFESDKLSTSNPEKNSVNNAGTQTILGETVKKARWRPTAACRFQYAAALVHGRTKGLILYDRTGRYHDPLIF